MTHADPEVRAQANLALPDHGKNREAVIATFLPALDLPADPGRGHEIFDRTCASCHLPVAGGNAPIGPARDAFRNAGKATLLTHILDPDREINPAFLAYNLTTRSGDSLAGLVAEQGDRFLTFRLTTGEDRVIAQSEVAELRALGTSLMPVGLEAGMSIQDMADLLEFIAGGVE
jgi:putative heme-binding domain-containing protein